MTYRHRRLRGADPTVTLAMHYWRVCHEQRRAWQGQPDDMERSELWLSRAMGLSAFIDWLNCRVGR